MIDSHPWYVGKHEPASVAIRFSCRLCIVLLSHLLQTAEPPFACTYHANWYRKAMSRCQAGVARFVGCQKL